MSTSNNNNILQAGVLLKKAIDSAPKCLEPIGQCVTAEEEWRADRYGSDEDEEPRVKKVRLNVSKVFGGETTTSLDIDFQDGDYNAPIILTNDMNLVVKGERIPLLSIDEDRIVSWYNGGTPSAYGNLSTMTTVIDENVRRAKEIAAFDFTVDESVIKLVEGLWCEEMFPKTVRVIPYKISLYGPGDHFAPHQDTAEKNLVGTFLLGLGDTSDGWFNFPRDG